MGFFAESFVVDISDARLLFACLNEAGFIPNRNLACLHSNDVKSLKFIREKVAATNIIV